MTALSTSVAITGLLAALVYATASFTQIGVGWLIDRFAPKWVLFSIGLGQIVFIFLAARFTDLALFFAMLVAMSFVFGQIPITDTILLLQYVEIRGGMARALNVFKMRGSWHDKGIREFVITGNGPQIKDSFSNFERIISGVPHRVTTDERSELSRIARGVSTED